VFQVAKSLIESFKATLAEFCATSSYILPTVLDPSTKAMEHIPSAQQKDAAWTLLRDQLLEEFPAAQVPIVDAAPPAAAAAAVAAVVAPSQPINIADLMKSLDRQFTVTSSSPMDTSGVPPQQTVHEELQAYQRHAGRPSVDVNPLFAGLPWNDFREADGWWGRHRKEFPRIAKLARCGNCQRCIIYLQAVPSYARLVGFS